MIGQRINVALGHRLGVAVGVSEDPLMPPVVSGGTTTTLSVAIADSVDPAITHVNFAYSIVVTNTGGVGVDATSVVATVTLDASLAYVSSSGTGWATSAVGQVVTCTRATLADGAAPTITVTVTSADSAGTPASTADVSAANAPSPLQAVQQTTVKLVDRDATSGMRVPSTATQWTDFNAYQVAIGTANYPNVSPASVWQFQQASGNSTDAIGGITCTPANWTTFQSPVTGWTRVAIRGVDAAANSSHSNTTTAPNPSLTSTLVIAYLDFPAAPAAQRDVFSVANNCDLRWASTGKLQLVAGATATSVSSVASSVQAVALRVNNTATTITMTNLLEKLPGTYAAPQNAIRMSFGGVFVSAPAVGYLYAMEFTGASAEMSDAGLKSLKQALGFTIPWA